MAMILLKSEKLSLPPPHYNLTIVQWGQWLDHDIDHSLEAVRIIDGDGDGDHSL